MKSSSPFYVPLSYSKVIGSKLYQVLFLLQLPLCQLQGPMQWGTIAASNICILMILLSMLYEADYCYITLLGFTRISMPLPALLVPGMMTGGVTSSKACTLFT